MAVEKDQLKRIVEGAIFASEKPLTVEHQQLQLQFQDVGLKSTYLRIKVMVI